MHTTSEISTRNPEIRTFNPRKSALVNLETHSRNSPKSIPVIPEIVTRKSTNPYPKICNRSSGYQYHVRVGGVPGVTRARGALLSCSVVQKQVLSGAKTCAILSS